MNTNSEYIIGLIEARQNKDKATWLENYVKHDIKSLGVGIPAIREIVKQSEKELHVTALSIPAQKKMLDDLMLQSYTEHKLAAILYIQLFWKNTDPDTVLNLISDWFDQGAINDWNVCDWLCVRLLSPLLDRVPRQAVNEFTVWNQDPNQWKARASLVPFAQCKTIERHTKTIFEFSIRLIKREERFCKTAVGWVMREYSKINPQLVIDFLENHKEWMSNEVRKNAAKYIDY